MPKIVCSLDLSDCPDARDALKAVGTLVLVPPERQAVLAQLADCEAYLANAAVRIDADFLARAPALKIIGSPSTGTDHMDLAAIRRSGVTLFDIAKERQLLDGFTATSECAFALILGLARNVHRAVDAGRRGDWARESLAGVQLFGKTLGILGLGRLGQISARIGNGFGMKVLATDIAPVTVPSVEMVEMSTLLKRSDILTIHLHLNDSTRGLIGERELAQMKPSAFVINTSRGGVIDEAALLRALQSSKIAGAGLDVIDGEWMPDKTVHPLIAYAAKHDNLLITPHIGGATRESITGARIFMAAKVAAFLRAAQS